VKFIQQNLNIKLILHEGKRYRCLSKTKSLGRF